MPVIRVSKGFLASFVRSLFPVSCLFLKIIVVRNNTYGALRGCFSSQLLFLFIHESCTHLRYEKIIMVTVAKEKQSKPVHNVPYNRSKYRTNAFFSLW